MSENRVFWRSGLAALALLGAAGCGQGSPDDGSVTIELEPVAAAAPRYEVVILSEGAAEPMPAHVPDRSASPGFSF